jgi:hypothetical protein
VKFRRVEILDKFEEAFKILWWQQIRLLVNNGMYGIERFNRMLVTTNALPSFTTIYVNYEVNFKKAINLSNILSAVNAEHFLTP